MNWLSFRLIKAMALIDTVTLVNLALTRGWCQNF